MAAAGYDRQQILEAQVTSAVTDLFEEWRQYVIEEAMNLETEYHDEYEQYAPPSQIRPRRICGEHFTQRQAGKGVAAEHIVEAGSEMALRLLSDGPRADRRRGQGSCPYLRQGEGPGPSDHRHRR